jgi:hypothetical protein
MSYAGIGHIEVFEERSSVASTRRRDFAAKVQISSLFCAIGPMRGAALVSVDDMRDSRRDRAYRIQNTATRSTGPAHVLTHEGLYEELRGYRTY